MKHIVILELIIHERLFSSHRLMISTTYELEEWEWVAHLGTHVLQLGKRGQTKFENKSIFRF